MSLASLYCQNVVNALFMDRHQSQRLEPKLPQNLDCTKVTTSAVALALSESHVCMLREQGCRDKASMWVSTAPFPAKIGIQIFIQRHVCGVSADLLFYHYQNLSQRLQWPCQRTNHKPNQSQGHCLSKETHKKLMIKMVASAKISLE